jgi:uncharacterized protein YabE (DUF348 family)
MHNPLKKLKLQLKRPSRLRLPKNKHEFKTASRHPFAVPFITFAALLLMASGIFLTLHFVKNEPLKPDAKIVIVSHDNQQQTVPSGEETVGGLLEKLDIQLNKGDVVEPAKETKIDQDQFRINVYRAVPVTVVDGDKRVATASAARTPRAIAQQTGEQLYPEDKVTTSPAEDFLKTGSIGELVTISRATPVDVDLYGTHVILRTHAKTVGGLAREKNIKLVQNDRMVPAADTPISAGQHIAFIRTGTKTETVTEEIATPVQTINDPTLAYGTKAVRQKGSPGQQTVTYEVVLNNNVVTARKVIQKVIVKAAVAQIEVMGTSLSGIKGDMALAGISPSDYAAADYIISHESGWRPNAGGSGVSGPYGLCQAYPGTKMATAGADWQTNPITQLRWCSGYASRYGGWQGSYQHWLSHHSW